MRIGIVNDMKLACEALRRVVSSASGHQVVWTANDGAEAVELAAKDRPDLILMDLIMPRVDGVEATRRIMAQAPCAILVVTSSVTGNIAKVYEAMSHGAQDAVDTPVLGPGGRLEGASALLHKIGLFEKLLNKSAIPRPAMPRPESTASLKVRTLTPDTGGLAGAASTTQAGSVGRVPLIVIGVSTGGPQVDAQILASLPRSLPACVVITQHIDANFAPGLVTWLGQQSVLPVEFAVAGQPPAAGRVFLAQTREHLILTPSRRFGYTPEPRESPFTPSVDVFFASVARHWPEPGIAVILTGMERDGAQGMLALRRAGWYTIAQDPATCKVASMPKAAIELGAVSQILAPQDIAGALISRVQRRLST